MTKDHVSGTLQGKVQALKPPQKTTTGSLTHLATG